MIIAGFHQRLKQQRKQLLRLTRWSRDVFRQIAIRSDRLERSLACGIHFRQILSYELGSRKTFRQGPLERIIPQVRGESAESLLERRGTAQHIFTEADVRWT